MSFTLLQSRNSSIKIFSHHSRLTNGRVVQSRNTENYRDERLTRRIFAQNMSCYLSSEDDSHNTVCAKCGHCQFLYSTYAVHESQLHAKHLKMEKFLKWFYCYCILRIASLFPLQSKCLWFSNRLQIVSRHWNCDGLQLAIAVSLTMHEHIHQ